MDEWSVKKELLFEPQGIVSFQATVRVVIYEKKAFAASSILLAE